MPVERGEMLSQLAAYVIKAYSHRVDKGLISFDEAIRRAAKNNPMIYRFYTFREEDLPEILALVDAKLKRKALRTAPLLDGELKRPRSPAVRGRARRIKRSGKPES